jgi:hypothetical protein
MAAINRAFDSTLELSNLLEGMSVYNDNLPMSPGLCQSCCCLSPDFILQQYDELPSIDKIFQAFGDEYKYS